MSRRIKAILFVDVTDSTGLLASGEPGNESKLASVMRKIKSDLAKRGGQQFFSAGDGVGFLFNDIQTAAHAGADVIERLRTGESGSAVRIGLHSGEVTRIENAYYGIAINVAARLQARADPNTICASASAAEGLAAATQFEISSLGGSEIKGLTGTLNLVAVRRLQRGPGRAGAADRPATSADSNTGIAVLPFTVQAEEERWTYLADGFTEDLTGNLSRFKTLTVISPHSSFEVSRSVQSLAEITTRLGVAYLVRGRIRVAGDRMRVSASLTATATGTQLWAEKFDRPVHDLFEVMDDISSQLASHLATRVEHVERRRAQAAHPDSLESYELLLRGLDSYLRHTRQANNEARRCFRRALRIEPDFARAYSGLSKTHNLDWRYRWSKSPDRSIGLALEYAQIAVESDRLDARGHAELGFAHLYRRELEESLAAYEEALELNPNDADVIAEYGDALIYSGDPQLSIDLLHKAMRLNPAHPDWYYWVLGGAYHQARRYHEAIATLRKMKDPSEASRLLAASHARLGHAPEAARAAERVMQKHPRFSITDWEKTQPFRRSEDLLHFVEGMREAGLK